MIKHCTNCDAFAWWDGDFCCVERMSIIEGAPDGKFWAILPDAFDAKKCEDYKHDLAKNRFIDYETQYIDFVKESIENTKEQSNEFLLEKYGYKHYNKN